MPTVAGPPSPSHKHQANPWLPSPQGGAPAAACDSARSRRADLELLELALGDTAQLEEQATGGRGLAGIDMPAGRAIMGGRISSSGRQQSTPPLHAHASAMLDCPGREAAQGAAEATRWPPPAATGRPLLQTDPQMTMERCAAHRTRGEACENQNSRLTVIMHTQRPISHPCPPPW